MPQHIFQKKIAERQQQNLYRIRKTLSSKQDLEIEHNDKKYLSFASNNYLGLASHPKLIKALQDGAEKYGVGSGASALISGYTKAHQAFEEAFAEFVQRDKAILFGNGYAANIGTIQALISKNDFIYQDKLNHASLIDAGLLSSRNFKRYPHSNLENLKQQLQQQKNKFKLIVTDSVFSMNGRIARLPELTALAKQENAYVMVDDAHGIGILGNQGRGTLNHFGLTQQDVTALVCPLGKAFGCYGAIVAGSNAFIENIIQFARTYIYSTALPAAMACAANASLQIIQEENWRREKLQELITYFKNTALQLGLKFSPSNTAIQPFPVMNPQVALQLSQRLAENNILVSPIRPPSVPQNTACLRITLTCLHEKIHIDKLLHCLAESQKILCESYED